MEVIYVKYAHFPDTEDGRIGFKVCPKDNECVSPNYDYFHDGKKQGTCHILTPTEMDDLATQVGAMTRQEFIDYRTSIGKRSWIDAYSNHLSIKIGAKLESDEGIVLLVKGKLINFRCHKGEFIIWVKKNGNPDRFASLRKRSIS